MAQHVGVDMAQQEDVRRVVTARFRIEIPSEAWVSEISRTFPDATFRLLAGVPTERGAMHLGEVRADSPAAVSRAIESHPSVVSYRRLHAADGRGLARYETAEAGLYGFVERTALVPDYPVVVRDGWFEVALTDTRDRFDAVRSALNRSSLTYELLSVVQSVDRSGLLTDRQRELLERALQEGYFEVPRECTLGDVADTVGVDTSTASGVLRRAQARLVTHHLSTPRQ